jgi:hypothetical protein
MSDSFQHLSASDRRRGQRYALLANLLTMVSQIVVQGVIMMLYANDVLGYSPRRIAGILSLMPLAGLLRLAFLSQIRRFGKVRLLTVTSVIRLCCIIVLLVLPSAMLPFPVFLTVLLLYACMQHFGAGAVWQPLLRDITTQNDRGRFFARMRFCFTALSAIVTALLPLLIGEQITERQFKSLLVLAAVGQFNHLFWVWRIPEQNDAEQPQSNQHGVMNLRRLIKNSALLRSPLVIACVFVLIGLPMYPIYLRKMIQAPSDLLSWILFAGTLGGGVSFLLWGSIADQLGFKPMLKGLLYISVCLLPSHVLIAPFDNIAGYDYREWISVGVLLTHAFIGGALSSGIGIAMTSIQHAWVQQDHAIEEMNVFQAVNLIVAAGMAVVAGWLLETVAIPVGMLSLASNWVNLDVIRVYLIVVGIGGTLCILYMLRRIPNSRPYFAVVDFFSALAGNPMRIGFAQRNLFHEDEDRRLQTVDWLGKQNSPLVLDLLIRMLDDPSYDVCVNAVRALAGTKSSLAGENLLKLFKDPARRSIHEHIAWALGELKYAEAEMALLAALAPDNAVRVRAMAARALGKLNSRKAAQTLADLLTSETLEQSQHLVASACRGLLRVGDTAYVSRVFGVLNGLSSRVDRYEIMDVLCLYLSIPNAWVLKAFSTISPRDALLDYVSFRSKRWKQQHADLINCVLTMQLDSVRAAYGQAIKNRRLPDPVLDALHDALQKSQEWGPIAVLASAWLMLNDSE